MRRALFAAAVLAVVLPTALIPHSASARGDIFSVQQVLRVFRAEGLPLRRDTDSEGSGYEAFAGGGREHVTLSVDVFEPGVPRPESEYLVIGSQIPHFAKRGNVEAMWTAGRRGRQGSAAIRAALGRLRYSPSDAARSQLPTIVLHSGQTRFIDAVLTPPGSEVDCVDDSADVRRLIARRPAPSLSLDADSGQHASAILRWEGVSGTMIAFSCLGAPASTRLNEGMFRLRIRSARRICAARARVIRSIGLTARIPPGWDVAASKKTVWIGNERRCGAPRHVAPHGIYLTFRLVSTISREFSTDRRFLLRPVRGAGLILREYGIYGDIYLIRGHLYELEVRLGRDARNAKAIRSVAAILRDVTRR